ncbi:MAG: hypothetical protein ACFB6R_00075 [Alphaproteobacteria bacterium]
MAMKSCFAIVLLAGLAGPALAFETVPLPPDAAASIGAAGAPFRALGIRGNSVQNTVGLYGGHRASVAPGVRGRSIRGFVNDRFALADRFGEGVGMGRKALRRLLKAEGYSKARGVHFQNGFYDLTARSGDDRVRLQIDALSGRITRAEILK